MASQSGSVVSVAGLETKMCLKLSNFKKIFDKIGDRPVTIVSVNGPMRTGKSYILAQFQRFLSTNGKGDWVNQRLDSEFQWKNSANRQTLGINLWSEPYFIVKDGREVAVLLMDTQGCFDDQTSLMESAYNFAISLLLSSVLIYNISKQITEDMLQFLQLFIGYANISAEEEGNLAERFQRLIFLIRDWQFPDDFAYGYYDDHHSASKKNFKKEKLEPLDGMPDQVRIVHQEILDRFQIVGCCLMPYPGQGLATRDRADRLSPEFVDIIKDLVPRIFAPSNLTIKTIGGKEVTGTILNDIAASLDQMLATNPIPDINTVAQENAEAQIRIATSVALKLYIEQMKAAKTPNGLQENQLQQLHNQAMERAVQVFKEMRQLRGNASKEQVLVALEHQIISKFKSYKELNYLKLQTRAAPIAAKTLEQDFQFENQSLAPRNHLVAQHSDRRRITSPEMRNPQVSDKPTSSFSAQSYGRQSAPPVHQIQGQSKSSLGPLHDQDNRPQSSCTTGPLSAAPVPVIRKHDANLQNLVDSKQSSLENPVNSPKTDQLGHQRPSTNLVRGERASKHAAHYPTPFTKAGQCVDANVIAPLMSIAGNMFTAIASKGSTHV